VLTESGGVGSLLHWP